MNSVIVTKIKCGTMLNGVNIGQYKTRTQNDQCDVNLRKRNMKPKRFCVALAVLYSFSTTLQINNALAMQSHSSADYQKVVNACKSRIRNLGREEYHPAIDNAKRILVNNDLVSEDFYYDLRIGYCRGMEDIGILGWAFCDFDGIAISTELLPGKNEEGYDLFDIYVRLAGTLGHELVHHGLFRVKSDGDKDYCTSQDHWDDFDDNEESARYQGDNIEENLYGRFNECFEEVDGESDEVDNICMKDVFSGYYNHISY